MQEGDRVTHRLYPHQEGIVRHVVEDFGGVPGLGCAVEWLEGPAGFSPSLCHEADLVLLERKRAQAREQD